MRIDNKRGMSDWLVFITLAESKNLTRAAEKLHLSTAAVSKALKRLENHVNAVLIKRDTRNFELTDIGRLAYVKAKEIILSLNTLLEEIRNPDQEVRGNINFYAPAIVTEFLAAQWINDYISINPKVSVNLVSRESRDTKDNFIGMDDLIFKSGDVINSDLVHRKVRHVKLISCASPSYINESGLLCHPRELVEHRILSLDHSWMGGEMNFFNRGESYSYDGFGSSPIVSNNILALINLSLLGNGVLLGIPEWIASFYISQGLLVEVLEAWSLAEMPSYLVWRHRNIYSPLFLDFKAYIERKLNSLNGLEPADTILQLLPIVSNLT